MQNEIVRGIAEKLRLELNSDQEKRLTEGYTKNREAYELYLKGRYYWNKRTLADLEKAISWLRQAAEKDPEYALAYAGLADCYALLTPYGGPPPDQTFPLAKEYARTALRLNTRLAEPHASLALIATWYDWDWVGAENEYKIAIALDARYATAHLWYAEHLTAMGRFEEAIAESKRAADLEPFSLMINAELGYPYSCARRFDEAIELYRKAIEFEPDFPQTHYNLGIAYLGKQLYEEALKEFQNALDLSADDPIVLALVAHTSALAGRKEEAMRALDDLKARPKDRYVPSYSLAIVYLGLGERDQSLHWLQQAYETRDSYLSSLNVDWIFDPLRSDPRFQEIVRKMKFPQK